MANKACVNRLRKELRTFTPPPYIRAAPLESNLQEWRYVLQGPPDSPYAGGLYQGKIRFPDDYPFRPPAIMMLTPNGRFETDRRLCLSMSDYHPELWVPAWSVATILNGVLSFMLEETTTVGSMEASADERKRLAKRSHAFNRKTPLFCELFADLVAEQAAAAAAAGEEGGADGAGGGADGADADGDGDARAQNDGWLLTAACGAVALAAVAYAAWGLWSADGSE